MTTRHPLGGIHSPDAFTHTVLLDAWAEGTRRYWLRRAEQLEAARPRPSDYNGHATLQDLADRWDRLTAAANACRARAELNTATLAEFQATLADLDQSEAAA